MAKLLILSDINVPYRVEVFKGLSKAFETVTFFNSKSIKGSHPDWLCHSDSEFSFTVLDNRSAITDYQRQIAEITQFDAVLCYDPWHKRSRKLQRLCIKKNVPFILNADGVLDINTRWLKRLIKSYYVRRATLCFAGCDKAVEYFKTYGAQEDKIIRHNFTSFYAKRILEQPYSPEQKSDFKRDLGLGKSFMFLAVGRFVEVKGFDLLLEAWGKTQQQGQLVIVGGGPLHGEYEAQIKRRQLKNVSVVGYVPQEKLYDYYAAADVFVMPTKSDVWGLVVNEAMASGLPVISSDRCTAGNELIKQSVNGFTYNCCNVEELSERLAFMEQNTAEIYSMSVNALKSIENYTFEEVINSHVAGIKAILHK